MNWPRCPLFISGIEANGTNESPSFVAFFRLWHLWHSLVTGAGMGPAKTTAQNFYDSAKFFRKSQKLFRVW
jgi:hypothetical protein